MQLIILGSGVGAPSSKRSAPGFCVLGKDKPILLDSGSGVAYQLPRAGLDYRKIDHIFYTHVDHPDHVNDLPEIIFAYKYDYPGRERTLNIAGPKGMKKFYTNLKRLYPIIADTPFPLIIEEVEENQIKFDDILVESRPLSHQAVKSVGYRVEFQGKSIVYSGDTDYCENLVTLSRECDLLVSECSFPDELKSAGHLTPSLAGRAARESGAKKLILIHLYPICEEFDILEQARKEYQGEIIVGEDLMKIDV